MALSVTHIVIVGDDSEAAQTIEEKFIQKDYSNAQMGVEDLARYLTGMASGAYNGKVMVFSDAGDGTVGTIDVVCTQANFVAGDTLVVAGVTFTAATSASEDAWDGEFEAGASDTAMGDNLAAAINAHPALEGMLTAANTTGTVVLSFTDKSLAAMFANASETGTSMAITDNADSAIGTAQAALRIFRLGL